MCRFMVPNPFRRNEPCSPALERARWELRLDRSRSGRDYLAMGLEDARCQVRPSEALRGGETPCATGLAAVF